MMAFPRRGSHWNLIAERGLPVVDIIRHNLGNNQLEFSIKLVPERGRSRGRHNYLIFECSVG